MRTIVGTIKMQLIIFLKIECLKAPLRTHQPYHPPAPVRNHPITNHPHLIPLSIHHIGLLTPLLHWLVFRLQTLRCSYHLPSGFLHLSGRSPPVHSYWKGKDRTKVSSVYWASLYSLVVALPFSLVLCLVNKESFTLFLLICLFIQSVTAPLLILIFQY